MVRPPAPGVNRSGPLHRCEPVAAVRRRPSASPEAPAPRDGAGRRSSLQSAGRIHSPCLPQRKDGGPAASGAGPLFTARFRTSNRPGMACLQATNESAPPERGD
ncbi:hypothetical protein NDU88_002787 [Pleurodeles waltl]|uniref:Uncharacterized protein n=1 Tax=Pleurodeles waltl TaxID=8319 RepID=A0AAV7TLP6_PLEWA|nr:hypothetical protein NDU88_002787 [Pleurodeles waltl]